MQCLLFVIHKAFGGNTSTLECILLISKDLLMSQVRTTRRRIKTLTVTSQGVLRVANIILVVSVIDIENTASKDGTQSELEH